MSKINGYYGDESIKIYGYGNEDEIRKVSKNEFNAMYRASKVDIVRIYPITIINNKEYYIGLIPVEKE